MLKCGISKEKITPELGMEIPGYFEVRKATGVISDLYAKAVVFESDGHTCALCVLDSIFTDRCDVISIRRKAQELCGILPDNVFIWASHSHTAGPVSGIFRVNRDKKYIRYMTDQAAKAIADAYTSRRPALAGSATGKVEGIASVRRFFMEDGRVETNPSAEGRLNPEGTPDETYTVIRIDDAETGKVMGFVSSFGLHLDTVGGDKICADYPGCLSDLVSEKYGADVESVFLTGPCGDVNHLNFDNPEETNTTQQIAEALFAGLCELDKKITTHSDLELCVKTSRFLIPLREETEERIKWAYGILDGSISCESGGMADYEMRAKAIVEIDKRIEDSIEIEIGAMVLGKAVVIEWPCEVFVAFARQIRRAYPGKDILIGEVGGGSLSCYVPTETAFNYGGYEPNASSAYCAEPDFGERMVSETLKMLGDK